jgi:hypothetical protein
MDDLTGKINELLSDPESMEKIKALAGMFAGSSGGGNSNSGTTPKHEEGKDDGGLPIDPEMLLRIKNALDIMKKDDPRIDLLLALKPNLSNQRRQKIDEAIHILRLLSLVPLLREQGIF